MAKTEPYYLVKYIPAPGAGTAQHQYFNVVYSIEQGVLTIWSRTSAGYKDKLLASYARHMWIYVRWIEPEVPKVEEPAKPETTAVVMA